MKHIKTNYQLIELYAQAEDYFFKSISKKYLDLNDNAICYMTGVPVADLNIVYIKKHPSSLDKILNSAKLFYDQDNLEFIVIIPEEFCSAEASDILKAAGYFSTEKSVAMVFELKNLISNDVASFADKIVIKANDNRLNDWMLPMIAFSATAGDLICKYADTHKLALAKKAELQHFSLYNQEKPIASITLSLNNNIARIDDVATLPEFQGKGYATRLMTYVLQKAKESDARYCFLEASESGVSIYQKLGFETLFKNNIYSRRSE